LLLPVNIIFLFNCILLVVEIFLSSYINVSKLLNINLGVLNMLAWFNLIYYVMDSANILLLLI